MDIAELYRTHKMWFILGGAALAGIVLFTYIKRKNSSSSASSSTITPSYGSSGGVSPSQYLVPYNAYFNGSQPDGGSTGTSTQTNASSNTTGSPSSAIPVNAAVAGTPAPATPSSGPAYSPVSQEAALSDIAHGIPIYLQGSSSIDFAQKHGGSLAGLNPNAFYQQNPTPQQINLAAAQGYQLYAAA